MTMKYDDISLLRETFAVAEALSDGDKFGKKVRKNGAIVISAHGEIIGRGANRIQSVTNVAAPDILNTVSDSEGNWVYYLLEHAERDAISEAYNKAHDPKGGTIYATLYPCADCARAIVAAGIKRVVAPNTHLITNNERNAKWADHFKYSEILFRNSGVTVDLIDVSQLNNAG